MNMKRQLIKFFGMAAIMIATGACSEQIMDEIDTDPNNPTDVPIELLLPNVTAGVPFNVSGTDLAWYSSIFVEQTAGRHGQMRDADRRANLNSELSENIWAYYIYPGILPDLKLIIDKGSEGGEEEGNWHAVGIAQVLFAYTMFVMTDNFGRVPYSEALEGTDDRKPAYDDQEFIYREMFAMLDDAIANFQKGSTLLPGERDLIYGQLSSTQQLNMWTRLAWSLKARYKNRLSKRDPEGSAADALEALANGFTDPSEGFVFDDYTDDVRYRNPWYSVETERGHHAVSRTIYDLMNNLGDPRIPLWFTKVQGIYNPAQNGSSLSDQAGLFYSKLSQNVVYDMAPLPILTFDELMFIKAECELRKAAPDPAAALNAFQEGLDAALTRAGVDQASIDTYKAGVVPADPANLTLEMIITQKYIALWPYGSIEAYAEWRRTGIPTMTNTLGNPPRRFPYPQDEISGNAENVPNVKLSDGVWWDDGSED